MNVLIIEDEQMAAQRLTEMLSELEPSAEIAGVLDSLESSIAYLKRSSDLDLIFMDIELGDGRSLEIFDQVKIDVPIIFITAYQEHALRAFKQNSIDYLLKPLHKSELKAALEKFHRLHNRQDAVLPPNMLQLLKEINIADQPSYKDRFLAKAGSRMVSVSTQKIAYFYTKDRSQFIKTSGNEDLLIDKPLDEIESELDGRQFFRANRQFIINYNHVEKVQAWLSGKLKVQVTPAAYEDIVVSRLRASDFKKWLGD